MENLDAIKARIRTLMSRTVAAGCTEAEAMAAAERAMQMMREHNLSPDQVECGRQTVQLGRRRRHVIDRAWGSVATACRCLCWQEIGGDEISHVYFGREPWPEIAAWLHGVVQGAHDREAKAFLRSAEYKRRRNSKTRAAARKAFSEGFTAGIIRKLAAMLPAHEAQARAADREIAQRALDKLNIEFSKAKPLPKTSTDRRFDGDRSAGFSSGDGTALNWGVGKTEQLKLGGPR